MFDSWIQRQSTINANKENYLAQPQTAKRKVMINQRSVQGQKVSFGVKLKEVEQRNKKNVNFINNDNRKR